MESPSAASLVTSGPRTVSRMASPWSSRDSTVPSSSTMPVNISGSPSVGFMVRRTLASAPVPTVVTSAIRSRNASSMVVIPRSPTALVPAPSSAGRDVGDHLVDQPGPHERGRQGRPALEEDVLPVERVQPVERLARVVGLEPDRLRAVVEDPPARVEVAQPHHGPQRLVGQRFVVLVAHGELRVVDLDRAGADQHHVALGPQPVGVDAARPSR